jgi:hypothetical protein
LADQQSVTNGARDASERAMAWGQTWTIPKEVSLHGNETFFIGWTISLCPSQQCPQSPPSRGTHRTMRMAARPTRPLPVTHSSAEQPCHWALQTRLSPGLHGDSQEACWGLINHKSSYGSCPLLWPNGSRSLIIEQRTDISSLRPFQPTSAIFVGLGRIRISSLGCSTGHLCHWISCRDSSQHHSDHEVYRCV